MNNQAIKSIDIEKFWEKYHFHWELNQDVNILIGINGSGKTTVLNLIEGAFKSNFYSKMYYCKIELSLNFWDGSFAVFNSDSFSPLKLQKTGGNWYIGTLDKVTKISTFDVPVPDKDDLDEKDSFLDLELERVIYQRKGEAQNFTNYRLNLTDTNNSEEEILKINRRIRSFFEIINEFFEKTEKTIAIDNLSKNIVFKTKDGLNIQLNQLSAGEKQLLIILFRVFLQDEKPYILLMDEPELSLHVYWQEKLIDTLRKLNPNCQLIIATHSGSIFSQGYEDKVFWMEDLMKSK